MSYPNLPAPSGDHPDFVKFNTPGENHTMRLDEIWDFMSKPFNPGDQPSQVFAGSGVTPTGEPISISFGGPGSRFSLYRQFYEQRPPLGTWVRVTFTGFEGQAKLFTLEQAPAGSIPDPPNAPAPQQAPAMPAPAATPAEGFPPAEAYAPATAPAAPEQPFGAGAPAAPWGQAPAPAAPPAAPWGQ